MEKAKRIIEKALVLVRKNKIEAKNDYLQRSFRIKRIS